MEALLARNPEAWSSISGMMAILALPPYVDRGGGSCVRKIEVMVNDQWQAIDRLVVTGTDLHVYAGVNGHSREWTFPLADPIPPWRPRPSSWRDRVESATP